MNISAEPLLSVYEENRKQDPQPKRMLNSKMTEQRKLPLQKILIFIGLLLASILLIFFAWKFSLNTEQSKTDDNQKIEQNIDDKTDDLLLKLPNLNVE